MPLIKPLCSVGAVLTEIGNEQLDPEIVISAINATTAFVEEVLGRRFDFITATEGSRLKIRKAQGWVAGDSIWLPLPCRTLTGVWFAGTPWTADEDFILESTRRLVAVRGYWWPEDSETGDAVGSRIELAGTFGYAPGEEPGDPLQNVEPHVARAAVLIAANLTSQNRRDTIGLDGNRQTLVDKWIPKPAMELLKPPAFVV